MVEGISHHDASQGHLGNCWFVAACSVLSGVPEMWSRVVPNAGQYPRLLFKFLIIAAATIKFLNYNRGYFLEIYFGGGAQFLKISYL